MVWVFRLTVLQIQDNRAQRKQPCPGTPCLYACRKWGLIPSYSEEILEIVDSYLLNIQDAKERVHWVLWILAADYQVPDVSYSRAVGRVIRTRHHPRSAMERNKSVAVQHHPVESFARFPRPSADVFTPFLLSCLNPN